MRGPEDMGLEYMGFDVLTLRGIWDRLIKYAFEHGTSLGATADCAGISKSAVYRAIRSLRGNGVNNIDSSLEQILTLCKELGANPTYILSGTGSQQKDMDYVQLSLLARQLPEEAKEMLRMAILSKVRY